MRKIILIGLVLSVIIIGLTDSWVEAGAYALFIGLVCFTLSVILDGLAFVGRFLARQLENQSIELHYHEHKDPTRPDEEVYPAVLELKREKWRRK